jgi:hypothetical protein
VPGTYECATQSIKESPQEILCLEGGVITFWPIRGDKFTWNASSGKKIKLIPKKVSIDSGVFVSFFNFYKNICTSNDVEYYFLTDENNDSLVDENSDIFQIK